MNITIHILTNGDSQVSFSPRKDQGVVLIHEEHLDSISHPAETGTVLSLQDARDYYSSLKEKGYTEC
jgi:hypothetical protein